MKVSGRVVSTKPISVSRAAKLISRFAAVENGSSPAVSLYLQRTSDAFNQLVQFHDKRSKPKNLDSKNIQSLHTEKESENEAPAKNKKKKRKRKSGEAEKSRAEALDS